MRSPGTRLVAASLSLALSMSLGTIRAADQRSPDDELKIFKAWLEHRYAGYGCDEGPARFRNETVEAAYAGRRFYYVLTYTRGIRPPFEKALSLVVHLDGRGNVQPVNFSAPEAYRAGLKKVSGAAEARLAAAAVLILAMGDPGERRWKFRQDLFTVKRSRKGWVCTYRHGDEQHTSQVTFDRNGVLLAFSSNPPPVP